MVIDKEASNVILLVRVPRGRRARKLNTWRQRQKNGDRRIHRPSTKHDVLAPGSSLLARYCYGVCTIVGGRSFDDVCSFPEE